MSGRSSRSARVLMVHRYFHPDAPPYATMLRAIAQRLAADGHDVHVFSSMPTYNDTTSALTAPSEAVDGGVHVRRMRLPRERKDRPVLRALLAALFLVGVFSRIVRLRPDLVTFSTMPPVALGLVVRAALAVSGRSGRYLYHCQDLHPEVETIGSSAPGPLMRLAARLEAGTRHRAAAVVVLSADMAATVTDGGTRRDHVHEINNFSLVEKDRPRPARGVRPPTVVFAGNLGRFQGLDVVAAAVPRVLQQDPTVRFRFLGDGPARRHLEPLQGPNVELLGYRPPDEVFAELQEADLGLVSLQPGLLSVAYPSKTMTYLAAGCGLVVVGDTDSALADLVRENALGTVAGPGDPDGLADAVLAAVALIEPGLPERAEDINEEDFGREGILKEWSVLVSDLTEPGP